MYAIHVCVSSFDDVIAILFADVFSITNGRGRVANLMLTKKSFKLGEDIIGRFVFDDNCLVPCLQYCVSLQSIEELDVDYRKPDQSSLTHLTTHATEHAVCLFVAQSQIKLHIPLSATPTFFNDIGLVFAFRSTSYSLYFQFDSIGDYISNLSHAKHHSTMQSTAYGRRPIS